MEILVAVLCVAVGVLAGIVGYDLRTRLIAVQKVVAAEAKLEAAARGMADAHNAMAIKVVELNDRVQSHELKLGQQASGPLHPFPGRRS